MATTDETEYVVECFGGVLPAWYFVSRLRGLTRAVELAAVMREIKVHPARVRPAEKRVVCGYDGPIPMLL